MRLSFLGIRASISEFAAFLLFSWLNLIVFMDRGIIPGSTVEFNSFIVLTTGYSQSDVLLGLLQSSFVVGLVSGALIFGHLSHSHGPFFLTGVGISIWIVAVFCSGLAYYCKSYLFLLFARVVSGLGEASLLCNIPPWLQKNAPPGKQGAWLGIFYTAIPVGTAFGYAYSAAISSSIGWPFAFFCETIITIPVVFIIFGMQNDIGLDGKPILSSAIEDDSCHDHDEHRHHTVSVWEELSAVLSSPVYVCLCFASAGTIFSSLYVSFLSSFLLAIYIHSSSRSIDRSQHFRLGVAARTGFLRC